MKIAMFWLCSVLSVILFVIAALLPEKAELYVGPFKIGFFLPPTVFMSIALLIRMDEFYQKQLRRLQAENELLRQK